MNHFDFVTKVSSAANAAIFSTSDISIRCAIGVES